VRRRLPEPVPAVKRALALLPHRPGVYLFRDLGGRVIYVGRSRDLAGRVHSYWSDLGDRPHLARMVERVAWVEPVLCESEHEAAFLERDLLERHRSRYNRTLGMESCVWLRLDVSPPAPTLDVAHDICDRDGATWFGPYLGWEPVRQAATGLLRIYPLRFSGTGISRSDRELARSLGVSESARTELAARIQRVLRRDPSSVRAAIRALGEIRDRAAENLLFEHAEAVQQQIRGLLWIAEPQKLAAPEPVDDDYCAVAGTNDTAVLVTLQLRGGRLAQREVVRLDSIEAWQKARGERLRSGGSSSGWIDMAQQNAELMAGLVSAGAVGPLGWRP
jgi:excinuclease ABC subunit C